MEAVSEDPQARMRQTVTHAWWAIEKVLKEQQLAALSELTHAQRAGADIVRPAARLAALEDVHAHIAQFVQREPKHA